MNNKTVDTVPPSSFDLLVCGGGINGVGIACDAAGRGLSVCLCEKDTLAAHTSSASTKLIHGGLRYLENFDFHLVKESLHEREILQKKAPHLIHPLLFVLPYSHDTKPYLLLKVGLWIYDTLAHSTIFPRSRAITFKNSPFGAPLKKCEKGFIYSDGFTDDTALVLSNAQLAQEKGAVIYTHTMPTQLKRVSSQWEVTLQHLTGTETIHARAIVNATGPWVSHFLQQHHMPSQHAVKLVQGSHIVVNRLYEGNHAYILQQPDKRIVFVIPYKNNTLIGTTEVDRGSDPEQNFSISSEEIHYLCEAVSRYFTKPVVPQDMIYSYTGVRPLIQNPHKSLSTLSRDYVFELNTDSNLAPMLSVFGGKITTYRQLAESALKRLTPWFPEMGNPWTATSQLP